MDSGVATRPIADFDAYREQLDQFVYQSGTTMQPVFAAAKQAPKRVVYAEGEDERVLRAAQVVVDEGLARPILVGRTDVIAPRIAKLGLRLKLGANCEVVNILDDPRYRDYWPRVLPARAARGRVARRRRWRTCAAGHADRRDAASAAATPTRCCAAPSATTPTTCATSATSIGMREGVQDARGDADADPARTGSSSSATRTSTAIPTPSRSPR